MSPNLSWKKHSFPAAAWRGPEAGRTALILWPEEAKNWSASSANFSKDKFDLSARWVLRSTGSYLKNSSRNRKLEAVCWSPGGRSSNILE